MEVYTEKMKCVNGFPTCNSLCMLPAGNCCQVSRNILLLAVMCNIPSSMIHSHYRTGRSRPVLWGR